MSLTRQSRRPLVGTRAKIMEKKIFLHYFIFAFVPLAGYISIESKYRWANDILNVVGLAAASAVLLELVRQDACMSCGTGTLTATSSVLLSTVASEALPLDSVSRWCNELRDIALCLREPVHNII